MKKRFLLASLALLIVALIVPLTVFAAFVANEQAKNLTTGVSYGTLSEAISEAKSCETVQLLKDISI